MDWKLTPGLLLRAYGSGIFPMAESADDPEIFWVDPSRRGVIPIDNFHISRSLAKTLRSERFQASFDADFAGVVLGCADRKETWINDTIFELYLELFKRGHAHSQEIWEGDRLVGGVYGVLLGSAFFGESMFSRRTDASKVALAYLIDRLRQTGATLFDTQFLTDHLATLGAIEIDRADYLEQLEIAVSNTIDVKNITFAQSAFGVLQRNGQTS